MGCKGNTIFLINKIIFERMLKIVLMRWGIESIIFKTKAIAGNKIITYLCERHYRRK
jgi:hypothetical protein